MTEKEKNGANLGFGDQMIGADRLDCMIALPGQLSYTTQIPVCLWFLSRRKKNLAALGVAI